MPRFLLVAMAISALSTFPEPKCDPDCLPAQLDAYYDDKCKVEMPAVSGASGAERAPGGATTTDPETDTD